MQIKPLVILMEYYQFDIETIYFPHLLLLCLSLIRLYELTFGCAWLCAHLFSVCMR